MLFIIGLDPEKVKDKSSLQTKSPFLSKGFFTVWTIVDGITVVAYWNEGAGV